MSQGKELTTTEKEAALAGLAAGLSMTGAARLAKVARQTLIDHRNTDEAFSKACLHAIEQGTEALEDEARRRGIEGVVRKKFDKGQPIIDPATGGHYLEREYSDTLLIFMLKARRPEKYRDNVKVETDQTVNVNIKSTSELIAAANNGGFHRTNRLAALMGEANKS